MEPLNLTQLFHYAISAIAFAGALFIALSNHEMNMYENTIQAIMIFVALWCLAGVYMWIGTYQVIQPYLNISSIGLFLGSMVWAGSLE
jgi:hypothetical protein